MNWKQWKLGLFVAMLTGLASGMVGVAAGWAVGLTRQQLIELFAVQFLLNIGKDLLLYLQQHPADDISFDTTHITRTTTVDTTVKTPSESK